MRNWTKSVYHEEACADSECPDQTARIGASLSLDTTKYINVKQRLE